MQIKGWTKGAKRKYKFRRPFQRPQVSKGQRPLVAPRRARNSPAAPRHKGNNQRVVKTTMGKRGAAQ